MEESVTRRRHHSNSNIDKQKGFYLYEELVILMGDRVITPFVPDPLSLCLRAAILGELIICDFIKLGHGNIVVIRSCNTTDYLTEKTLSYIRKADCTVEKWLEILNGENFSTKYRYQIKKVRHRVYKKLSERGTIRFANKVYSQSVKIVDQEPRDRLAGEVVEYLAQKREGDFRIDILVCCLFFCKTLTPLFSSLSLQKQSNCKSRAEDVISLYRNYYRRECSKENMVALLLKSLLSK